MPITAMYIVSSDRNVLPFYNSMTHKSYYGDIVNYKLRTHLIDI